MADTTFVDGDLSQANRIVSAWLNAVNNGYYRANSGITGVTAPVYRTALSKFSDFVSVLDFIPPAYHAAIKAGTSTQDVYSYIQAAHDSITLTGVIWFPGGKYKCNTGLTLNVSKVKFQGEYATLDFSGGASNIVGIQVTGNGTGTAFANAPGGMDGISLTGPGDLTTACALRFTSTAEAGPSYASFGNGYLSGWLNGALTVNNAYLLTFMNMNVRVGGSCFVDTSTGVNSGERISILSCTLSGAQYGVNAQDPDGDWYLTNTSIDVNIAAVYARGSNVALHGCHIEGNGKAVDGASSGGTPARVLFSGCRFIQTTSSGATPYLDAGNATFLTIMGGDINPHASTTTSISMNVSSRLVLKNARLNYSGPVDALNGCAADYWPSTSAGVMNSFTPVTGFGSTTAADATFTTIFAPAAAPGRYVVSAYLVGGGTNAFQGMCDVVVDDGTHLNLWNENNGASFDFQLSGGNLQAKQSSGSSGSIRWSYLRIN